MSAYASAQNWTLTSAQTMVSATISAAVKNTVRAVGGMMTTNGTGNVNEIELLAVLDGATIYLQPTAEVGAYCEQVYDEAGPGMPRRVGDEDVERVLTLTLETMPRDATHWSTRSMATKSGLSQTGFGEPCVAASPGRHLQAVQGPAVHSSRGVLFRSVKSGRGRTRPRGTTVSGPTPPTPPRAARGRSGRPSAGGRSRPSAYLA